MISVVLTLGAHPSGHGRLENALAQLGGLIGLFGVACACYLCFVYAKYVGQKLGQSRAQAINRLFAFITLCIGAQIIYEGIKTLPS